MVLADDISEFVRKLNRGNWEWVALFTNRKKPAKRPDKELKNNIRMTEENARQVIQEVIQMAEDPEFFWISFIGTKGRPDTYVFTHKPYSEVFGTEPAKKKVWQIAEEISTKLSEAGLRNLGTRHAKAGEQFSTDKGNARRIAVGRRELILNVFNVTISRDDHLRRPDTRWGMWKSVLLSKVNDKFIDAAVKWVKKGPTQIEVRDAAREEYRERQMTESDPLAIVDGSQRL
jgi:hypothetical protein